MWSDYRMVMALVFSLSIFVQNSFASDKIRLGCYSGIINVKETRKGEEYTNTKTRIKIFVENRGTKSLEIRELSNLNFGEQQQPNRVTTYSAEWKTKSKKYYAKQGIATLSTSEFSEPSVLLSKATANGKKAIRYMRFIEWYFGDNLDSREEGHGFLVKVKNSRCNF